MLVPTSSLINIGLFFVPGAVASLFWRDLCRFCLRTTVALCWEFRKMFVGLLIVEVGKSPGKELAIFRIKPLSFRSKHHHSSTVH